MTKQKYTVDMLRPADYADLEKMRDRFDGETRFWAGDAARAAMDAVKGLDDDQQAAFEERLIKKHPAFALKPRDSWESSPEYREERKTALSFAKSEAAAAARDEVEARRAPEWQKIEDDYLERVLAPADAWERIEAKLDEVLERLGKPAA